MEERNAEEGERVVIVRCGRLIDGISDDPIENVVVVVRGDKIRFVSGYTDICPMHSSIVLGETTNHHTFRLAKKKMLNT